MPARAKVVINEILYRPGTGFPEDTGREFIELFNTDPAAAVDLSGWAFTSGVNYIFPAGTTIPAGGFVVVASNPASVQQAFGITGVLGPWTAGATLSNRGERVRLVRPDPAPGAPAGKTVTESDVTYASEGDWATRVRETRFGGWDWSTPANGGGKSIELRNPALTNDSGQNWGASTAASGGTPKAPNTVLTGNVAPIIRDVKHSPAVPRSNEPVRISCKLTDETAAAGLTATLFWRDATSASPGPFQTLPMLDPGTGKLSATIGAMPDRTIVEFYISATDGTNTRTWPAATSEGQNANSQYQVTDETLDPNDSYYFLVLTGAENAAYNATAPLDSAGNKIDRQFNTTLIVAGGEGASIRYRTSIRFRGNSSRSYQFKPLRVSVPLDDRLDGVSGFNIHPRGSYLQYIGFRMFGAAGVRAEDAVPVELRRNGIEYTSSSGGTADFGKWVRVEDIGGDFVDNHWPQSNGGNAYRKTRPDQFWRATQPAPSNPDALLDGWSKQNNGSANDWSDLRTFFQTWQTAAAPHFTGESPNDVDTGTWDGTAFTASEITTLETVSDFDQWARWFAVMTILQDYETNISNGQDDDYGAYFEPNSQGQRRMHLIPHDLDTVLGQGDTARSPDARGLYDMTDENSVFSTLLPLFGNNTTPGNAAFRAKYLAAIRELYGTVFNADTTGNPNPPFYSFLDNHLTGWAPASRITEMKTFATARQSHLLGLIGSGPIVPPTATSTATLNSPHGPLVISEVFAHNVAAVANGAAFPDVIELHNAGATSVDLGGMSLTDDPLVPARYVFPAGTTIAAGGFLVVCADDDVAAPGLHTGFGLDRDGDEIRLLDGATLVDSVVFGPQAADLSISRTGPALDVWALTTPTINAANAAPIALGAVSGVRINEIFTNPDYLATDDFAELYNPATQPVALGGVAVTDDPINFPARHTLPPLSFIAGRDFLALRPKGGSASPGNPTELPFKFSKQTAWAAVLGANGTMIDQIDTGALPPDVSRGRLPDGGPSLRNFGLPATIPTPGGPNVPPPAPILALLNGLRVTELLYTPNNLEFVELQNIGSATLDLSSVRFTAGIGYVFAPGTTLAPGAFTVIVKDRGAFTAQFPNAPAPAPGVFSGTLDNAGETVALQPPAPWNVNILSFEYRNDWYAETNVDRSLTVRDPAVTQARDWDERETWMPSAQPFGNPGVGLPPTITSTLTAVASINSPFIYQITATQSPMSFTATGLPAGLSVDTSSGLISGTTSEIGSFDVAIGAANAAGSDAQTLMLTVTEAGPLAQLTWDPIPAAQTAGVPFAVTLRATDAQGRTVVTYNGPAQVSAQREAGSAASVVFTEFGTSSPTPDYFEIQNVSGGTVTTNGWFVITNRSPGGANAALSTSWPMPASLTAGEITGASDSPQPPETAYPVDIDWPGNGPSAWAMLVDNTNTIRDFVAWGYTAAEIGSINFTFNGANFTVGAVWSGAGAPAVPAGQSLFRGGVSDNDTAADWSLGPTPSPRSLQNAGLTVPLLPRFAPLAASPAGSVNLVNGIWTGDFTVRDSAAVAELQASAQSLPLARSNSFAVTAPTRNTPPAFTKGPDQSLGEDAPPQTVAGWATGIFPGATSENGTQTVSFLVSADNPGLFAAGPAVASDGTLTFTPAPNASGSANVTVQAKDNGGTAGGGMDTSAPQSFIVTVLPVNDAPTITVAGDISRPQNAGPQVIPGWAAGIGPGAPDEASQTVALQITASNPALFDAGPTLTEDGTLTFTFSPDAFGTTNVVVTAMDNGGTASGGIDTTQRVVRFTSRLVNLPPSFTKGPDLIAPVGVAYGQQWAADVSPGSPAESSQTVRFAVTTDRPDLFKTLPAITAAGHLSFLGKKGGTATVTVSLTDNGGTSDGGIDASAPQTFTIDLTSTANATGKYRGLVQAPEGEPATHARSGRIEVKITKKGQFTGKLYLGGESHRLRGELGSDGAATFKRSPALQISRKGLPPMQLSFRAEVIESNPRAVTGALSENGAPPLEFTANADAYSKSNPVPATLLTPASKGNFTVVFTAQPAPNGGLEADQFAQGDGAATLKLKSKGTLKMRGRFADGSKFSYSAALDSANGFPLYVPLYRGGGAVAGQAAFDTSGPETHLGSEGLDWFRPPQSPLYPAGWPGGILLGLDGATRNVATEPNALPPGAATLTLTGGNLPPDGIATQLTIGPKNKLGAPASALGKLKLKLKNSGALSGSFIHPVTGKKTKLEGVTLRDPAEARGFFLGPTESGHVTIQP